MMIKFEKKEKRKEKKTHTTTLILHKNKKIVPYEKIQI